MDSFDAIGGRLKKIFVLISMLISFCAGASQTLCLSESQVQFRPVGYPAELLVEPTGTNPGAFKITVNEANASTQLIYQDSGETVKVHQVRFSCRKRAEDLLRARILVAIESLKINSQLALILMLQVGMNTNYDTSCGILEQSSRLESSNTKSKDLLGAEILMSSSDEAHTIMEYGYGMVYSTRFCR